jgi:galactose mutarotase-like enzyme
MKLDEYALRPDAAFSIAPEFGCNLISWTVAGRPVLYCPENFSFRTEDFYHAGNPILFPSVGRTWDRSGDEPVSERYRICGHARPFQMPIHGLLTLGQWAKMEEDISADAITVQYRLILPPAVMENHYPFPVTFRLRYTLKAASVRMEAFIENCGTGPAPFAFGLHPYFSVMTRDAVEIQLPCRSRMVLDPTLLIPVGKEPMDSSIFHLERDKTYDMGFTDVAGRQAVLIDIRAGRRVQIDFDANIEAFVIYSAPDKPFVCLEPWMRGLGAFETLVREDWTTGKAISVLRPGERRTIFIEYSVL